MDVLCKHTKTQADQIGVQVTRDDVFAVTLRMSVKRNIPSPETQASEPPKRGFFSRFAPS